MHVSIKQARAHDTDGMHYSGTRFNEPRYNEDPVMTKNIWKPGKITVRYVEKNPAIKNRFWRSRRTIYPAETNSLSGRSQESVKMTDESVLKFGFFGTVVLRYSGVPQCTKQCVFSL